VPAVPDSTTAAQTPTTPNGQPRADQPTSGELGHMARLADLTDAYARDWKAALASVPGGRMRARVKPWAEDYRADALGMRHSSTLDEVGE
jgi:hypothetical protein